MSFESDAPRNHKGHNVAMNRLLSQHLSRRRFLLASAATAGLGLLAACGGEDEAPPAATSQSGAPAATQSKAAKPTNRSGMLVSGYDSDPVDLTPHRYQGAASLTFKGCVYDALLAFNPQGEIVPHLAERFEWAQPTTLEFKLRQGVKFHNGSPLTSQDVKASLENIMSGDPAAFLKDSLSQTISSIETPDDSTVRLILKTTSAALLPQLAMPDTPVILPKDLLAQGNDFTKNPVGSGPFMYDRTEPGAFIMLKKNPDYWLPDQPNVDELKLLILPQPSARTDAIISGLTQIGETPPVIDFPRLDSNKDIKSVYQTNFMACIFFNLNHKPFADVRVREAISWAVDRQSILDAAYQGEGRTITGGVLHEPWFCQDLEGTYGKRDLDKARSLMKEAGFEGGFAATLMASNTPSQQLPAEVVRDNLKDININVTLDIIPFSETVGRQSRGDYHFRIQGTSYRLPDPDGFSLMFPSNHGYWAAGAGWQDAELDDLIQRGRQEMDVEKRKQIACDTQRALLTKLPWVFMAYGKGSSMAVRTDLVDGYHTDDWQGLVSLYAVQWHLRRLWLKA